MSESNVTYITNTACLRDEEMLTTYEFSLLSKFSGKSSRSYLICVNNVNSKQN